MEKFVKRMIEEHSQLVVRIEKLANYIYSEKSDKDSKGEFANKCMQLAAMRQYECALGSRLFNNGIHYDPEHRTYLERVATIEEVKPGSDFDADKK